MRRWFRLWQLAGNDMRIIVGMLRRPDRPRWLLPALAFLGFFALDPLNFALPVIGAVDDLVLLPLLIRGLAVLAHRDVSRLRREDDRVVSIQ